MSRGSKFPCEMVDPRRTPCKTPVQMLTPPVFVNSGRVSRSPVRSEERETRKQYVARDRRRVKVLFVLLGLVLVYAMGPCFLFYPFYDTVDVDFTYLGVKDECHFFRDLTKFRREIHSVMVRKYADTPPANREAFLRTPIDRNDLRDIIERKLSSTMRGQELSSQSRLTMFNKAIEVNKKRGVLVEDSHGVRLRGKPAFVTLDAFVIYDSETFWELAVTALWDMAVWCGVLLVCVCAYKACAFIIRDQQAEHTLYTALKVILEREGPLTPLELYQQAVIDLQGKLSKSEISDLWPSPGTPLGNIETRLRQDPTLTYSDEGGCDGQQYVISLAG